MGAIRTFEPAVTAGRNSIWPDQTKIIARAARVAGFADLPALTPDYWAFAGPIHAVELRATAAVTRVAGLETNDVRAHAAITDPRAAVPVGVARVAHELANDASARARRPNGETTGIPAALAFIGAREAKTKAARVGLAARRAQAGTTALEVGSALGAASVLDAEGVQTETRADHPAVTLDALIEPAERLAPLPAYRRILHDAITDRVPLLAEALLKAGTKVLQHIEVLTADHVAARAGKESHEQQGCANSERHRL